MRGKRLGTILLALVILATLLLPGQGCMKKVASPTPTPTPTPEAKKLITVTDLAGRTVELRQNPRRIITVYSQIPIAMRCLNIGLERIIGTDAFTISQYGKLLPELEGKEIVGRHFIKLDYEKIVDLEPELILTVPTTLKRTEIEEKLKPAGIKIVALDFKIKSFRKTLELLGKIFDREEEAKEFADFWFGRLEEVRKKVEGLSEERKVRVYLEGTQRPFVTASKGHTLDEIATLAGGINIAARLKGRSPEVEPEWVVEQNPDVILKYPMGAKYQGGFGKADIGPFEEMRKEIMERPGFDRIKAVREGRVYILSRDILGGVFENVGVCYAAKILYPELFKDLDPEAYLKQVVEKYLGLDFEGVKGVFVHPSPPAVKRTITVIDSAGREVEIPQPLERIAIWNGSAAEVIRALGEKERIIAINKYMPREPSYWPELKDRPQIGSPWDRDYEKIIMLEPQVLITYSRYYLDEIVQKLEPAGIKVLALNFNRLDSLQREIEIMGKVLGREERAREFADFLLSKVEFVEERIKEIKPEERKRVYWELGNHDYRSIGPKSIFHQNFTRAGGVNIFADLITGTSSEVDPEAILLRDPGVVIKDGHGVNYGGYEATDTERMEEKRREMMSRPGWDKLTAVKNGQVYLFGRGFGGGLEAPLMICYLAKLLYPDKFKDLDVEAFHREFLEKYQGLPFKGIYVYPCPWESQ